MGMCGRGPLSLRGWEHTLFVAGFSCPSGSLTAPADEFSRVFPLSDCCRLELLVIEGVSTCSYHGDSAWER